MFKKILFASLALAVSLQALVEKEIDEKHPIEAVLSKTSHNRIAVLDGAVEKIFGDSALFSVNIDASTGQAFVTVLQDLGEKPATLSVVTGSGMVQDILARSNDGPSEQIILHEGEEAFPLSSLHSHAAAIDLLNQILEGKIPFGYGQKPLEEALSLPEPLHATAMRAYEGPFETIAVYRIENKGEKPISLTTDALKGDGIDWVFLDSRELEFGKQALCIVGRHKE